MGDRFDSRDTRVRRPARAGPDVEVVEASLRGIESRTWLETGPESQLRCTESLADLHGRPTVGTSPSGFGHRSTVFSVRWSGSQELATEGEGGLAAEVGHKAEVTDANKALGQDMQQEAADELLGVEFENAFDIADLAVEPTKLNVLSIKGQQSMVGDGNAMGVTAQVAEDLFGSAEGRFGIDDPVVDVERADPGAETLGFFQGLKLGREADLAGGQELFEPVDELAAEHRAEDTAVDEEIP